MALEHKFHDIPVPVISEDDQVKTLGLLTGLLEQNVQVLYDEGLQRERGEAALAGLQKAKPKRKAQGLLEERIHALAKEAPIERYLRA